MTVSRFRMIIYIVAAIVSLAGLADATYLTVQALTGETLGCGDRQLFQGPRQVRESSRNSARLVWSACLFQCVHLRYVRGVRLRARAHISHSNRWRDVPRHALVALRPGLPAPRLLSLLPVFCGNHVSTCRAGDCSAARTREICRLSGHSLVLLVLLLSLTLSGSVLEHERNCE